MSRSSPRGPYPPPNTLLVGLGYERLSCRAEADLRLVVALLPHIHTLRGKARRRALWAVLLFVHRVARNAHKKSRLRFRWWGNYGGPNRRESGRAPIDHQDEIYRRHDTAWARCPN